MHKIEQLKEELLHELEDYAGRSKTKDDVVCIKYLASACDHLCNVLAEVDEQEYSQRSRRSYESGGSSGRRSYDDGAKTGSSMRRYDVERGRAWSDGPNEETLRKLEELKGSSDESTRRVIDKAIRELRG